MTEDEVLQRLDDVEQPWGIKRLLTADWVGYSMEKRREERERKKTEAERRLEAALDLICLEEALGIPVDRIVQAFDQLKNECQKPAT